MIESYFGQALRNDLEAGVFANFARLSREEGDLASQRRAIRRRRAMRAAVWIVLVLHGSVRQIRTCRDECVSSAGGRTF
jgi:hypothetical protein